MTPAEAAILYDRAFAAEMKAHQAQSAAEKLVDQLERFATELNNVRLTTHAILEVQAKHTETLNRIYELLERRK